MSSSVLRALRLLELFSRGEPELSLAEFVRRSGYSKTTTYRLLTTLEEAGWLERGREGRFRLTIKPFQVGSILVDSLELRREAGPIMAQLGGELDVTVYLIVADGPRATCLERIDSAQEVRVADLYVGGSQPLNLGAAPRALLAFDEEVLLPALLAEGLSRKTEHSVANRAELTADLQKIRSRGYSISDQDTTLGVAAIGAPIFASDGRAIAAMSIGALRQQLMPPKASHIDRLLWACREVSRRLGYFGPQHWQSGSEPSRDRAARAMGDQHLRMPKSE